MTISHLSKIILALATMSLAAKPVLVFATDSPGSETAESPPVCKDGYEYVEAVAKCYKACAEGWERNPETLRCRKIRETDDPADSLSSPAEAADPAASASPADSSSTSSSSGSSSGSPSSPSSGSSSSSAASPLACKDGYEYVESVGKCYKKCIEGYERNPETNRCRKATVESDYESSGSSPGSSSGSGSASSSSSSSSSGAPPGPVETPECKDGYEYVASAGKCYKACAEGQVRNPETNRCKKADTDDDETSETESNTGTKSCKEGYEYVESAGKCYKACVEGQERSPETNRCRKITTADTTEKKCEDGYELNPETNRCRKIKNNDGADYNIEVPETGGGTSFVAIGAIIALIVAGLAFVAFQYRAELQKFLKKHFKKS